MSQQNQGFYDALFEDEQVFRLAKECIAKIDAAGGVGTKPGGVERVVKKMLRIIKKKQRTGTTSTGPR